MKFGKRTYILAALAVMVGCTRPSLPTYSVGEEFNAIGLRAGIGSGNSIQSKADDSGHDYHIGFAEGSKAQLRVDGIWTGHTPSLVSQLSVATMSAEASQHNALSMAPLLFWDDYGTADPDNSSTGRSTGLSIYGAAVDGLGEAPAVASWTEMDWVLDIDQSGGWNQKDLLTSNNIKGENSLKFDEWYNDRLNGSQNANNLMLFTHAMTKISINLYADEGFPGYESGLNNAKFQQQPKVTLLGFHYKGEYNIENKSSDTDPANSEIIPRKAKAGAGEHKASFDALVFPGNIFDDDENILKLEADGNVYYVTAAKINAVNPAPDKAFLQGKEYILNIRVKKTALVLDATIQDWVKVEAEEVSPVINISTDFGQAGDSFTKDYDFYRSLEMKKGYDEDELTEGINPAASYVSANSPQWSKLLYWPDHDTHYFFRGVYPKGSVVETDGTDDYIAVENSTFAAETCPSELMIAIPRDNGTCIPHSYDTAIEGICATGGTIHMNFAYAMSKVELRLKSSGGSDNVDLSNVQVEIIEGIKKGKIGMKDGLHLEYTDTESEGSDRGDYTLSATTAAEGYSKTTMDAVMPQIIDDRVRFKISVNNSNGTKDIYYARVNTIKGSKNGGSPYVIKEWIQGEHYIYSLMVTKSQIKISATLKDWTVVDSEENIWM